MVYIETHPAIGIDNREMILGGHQEVLPLIKIPFASHNHDTPWGYSDPPIVKEAILGLVGERQRQTLVFEIRRHILCYRKNTIIAGDLPAQV